MAFAEGVPTVTVTLDQPRELGFTLGAMRRIREKLGSLELDLSDEQKQLQSIPTLVWACMDADARAVLSVEDVEEMIHPGNLGPISDAIHELLERSQPEAGGNPTKAAPKKRAAKK